MCLSLRPPGSRWKLDGFLWQFSASGRRGAPVGIVPGARAVLASVWGRVADDSMGLLLPYGVGVMRSLWVVVNKSGEFWDHFDNEPDADNSLEEAKEYGDDPPYRVVEYVPKEMKE